ncbi:MAG TPA: apolipoprotein N-acyltransferase [Xanthobacteraceae bacterium]|nr:apolipoprotein N-acyltransferase [Xanthobacteraceae bacterium]
MTLTRIAQTVVLAWGWKRILIAFMAGAVATLALPPLNIWPAPFLAFPVLVWLIDGTGSGRLGGVGAAAFVGWWFGFGYFVAGLYWIGNAFLVDAKTFGWLLPFAVILLPAGLAIFCAIGTATARLMWMRGSRRVLALGVALTFSEWLRGHVLTGFPWNAFGYTLASPLALAQSAALVGLWGLTFIAVLVYASPVTLADDASESTRRWLAPALAILIVAGMAAFGTMRLANTPTTIVDGVRLRIMQPNLQQDAKFNYSQKQQVMSHYIALSERADGPQSTGLGDITHLIWPESAFPFFLTREADALAQIATLLPDRTTLITGGVRPPETAPTAAVNRAYNSVYVIGHDGSILSVYDKVHLVPFGEYLPFQDYLEELGLIALTKMRGGFIPGDRRRILEIPRAPNALPLVCYEIIFPGAVLPAGERAGWIINLTNDGWFGLSVGPHQHFQQARLRAIEEGLPLVRAANTGISAVVDPLGNIVASLPLGAEGVFDSGLPQPLPPTPYARLGDVPVVLAVGISLVVVLRLRRRSHLKKLQT